MGQPNPTETRNSCCCLGAVALAFTAAFIVPGVLGVHKVIHLSKAGQGALLGIGALPALVTALFCSCACKSHLAIGSHQRTTNARRDEEYRQFSARRQPPSTGGFEFTGANMVNATRGQHPDNQR